MAGLYGASTLLHELYFASMGGDGQPTRPMSESLARDFGSPDRWRAVEASPLTGAK